MSPGSQAAGDDRESSTDGGHRVPDPRPGAVTGTPGTMRWTSCFQGVTWEITRRHYTNTAQQRLSASNVNLPLASHHWAASRPQARPAQGDPGPRAFVTPCVPLTSSVPTNVGVVGAHHHETWEMKTKASCRASRRTDPVPLLSPLETPIQTRWWPGRPAEGVSCGSADVRFDSVSSRVNRGPCLQEPQSFGETL